MAAITTTIEIMPTSIAMRSKMRDLVTATTTLIATTGLGKAPLWAVPTKKSAAGYYPGRWEGTPLPIVGRRAAALRKPINLSATDQGIC